MPLSEHEQRLLDEMERSLAHGDGDVITPAPRGSRPAYRSIVLGALLAVLGIVALLVGVIIDIMLIGVAGFALMVVGVLLAVAPSRHHGRGRAEAHSAGPTAQTPHPGFMDKLNDRWDKRQHPGH